MSNIQCSFTQRLKTALFLKILKHIFTKNCLHTYIDKVTGNDYNGKIKHKVDWNWHRCFETETKFFSIEFHTTRYVQYISPI